MIKNITIGKVIRFIIILIFSFLITELIEVIIERVFNFDFSSLKLPTFGWVGVLIYMGFKSHILCCIFPILFINYKVKKSIDN